ncbi:helix-turn-helix transcriptional regulator [Chryseobacterium manosquense]|uniref:Helix-turn-helix transcriptional regulator n=1 Tax=Chryseobacterium manosquense TaxID=2754694 RepID=A0A7H1DXD0_9FLAO|nr:MULTISPECIES: helix-turn-helix transcriptional regulator [Chryseobacterium]AYO58013.1 hypothetical protein CO230_07675 [Chryseobacterium sp. 6424]QNS41638.1 helix-turn-helix transcriptional regulator [Chryseobacterium manosquense]
MNTIQDKYFIALTDHLQKLLEFKSIEVAELAAAANLDRRQIYRLLNKENVPKLSTLIRISLAAGIEPKELFDFKFDFGTYMKDNKLLKIGKTK